MAGECSVKIIGSTAFSEELCVGEDTAFNIDCYANNQIIRTVCIDAELYYYYQRKDSATSSAEHDYYFELGDFYLKKARQSTSSLSAEVYLRQSFRELLLSREKAICNKHTGRINIINTDLKEALNMVKSRKVFSKKEAMQYWLLSKVPILYHLLGTVRIRQ